MALFDRREPSGIWWRDHSLGIVLTSLMVIQTGYALWTGWRVFQAEELDMPFWIWWSWEYNISLVADTFGVLLIVMLSKWFNEKGSKEG